MAQTPSILAEPFSRIFTDRAEAEWAFDLLRDTAKRLGINGAYDARFALTLAKVSGGTGLHLNFGGWLVLGFHGPDRVDLALLAERVAWDERFNAFPFERKEGEPEVRSYHLPLDILRPMTADLAAAYEATLDFIAHKFQSWKRAIHWQRHNPEIAEALFNPEKRERVLLGGVLNESERLYERHLTAFSQDISEEREEYEVGEAEGGGSEEAGEKQQNLELAHLEGVYMDLTQVKSSNQYDSHKELAYPFSRIFQDRKEAEMAFDFLHETLTHLGIKNFTDSRFALTLRHRNRLLRLNIGNWLVLDFCAPDFEPRRVDIALIRQAELDEKLKRRGSFFKKDNEPEVSIYELSIEQLPSLKGNFRIAYEKSLKYIGERFRTWKASNLRFAHQPEIAEAIFNLEKRKQIFDEGLTVIKDDYLEDTNEAIEPIYSLAQLAEDTGLDESELARWVRAIERKGQAILYGPPGTGKTFVAEKLARHLTGGGDGFWELVQFHPAYAYEDFIQGIRPESQDGLLTYPTVPGRFLEFCQKAATRQHTCVLIIDEINRANLSRVFGELMYLLEYRERDIPLAGGGSLKIPANVRLIGTMNTADRSIALVDHALRRRFAFIALYPNYDLLRRYHHTHHTNFPIEKLIAVLKNLNRTIGDRHYEVGVTFFLQSNLTADIKDIWRMEIEPYLEEYFFDRPEKLESFRWEKVEGKISGD